MLTIRIPALPVSVNHAFPTNRQGRRFKSSEYKKWCVLVEAHMPKAPFYLSSAPLSVEIDFCSPQWLTKAGGIRKADLDNRIKCCLDAVFAHLPVDDSHVFELKVTKVLGDEYKTEVRIFDLRLS